MTTPSPARIAAVFPLVAGVLAVVAYLAPGAFVAGKPAIVPLLVVIMFGMGLTLTPADFSRAITRWPVVLLGVVLQFGLMPLAAWAIANALALDAPLALGLILVGSVAGGTASNVICFLAGGDVALSITLTSIATLVSVVATPLLTWLYADAQLGVPVASMLFSIAEIVIVPVVAGMAINLWIGDRWRSRDGWCALGSSIAIAVVIAIIVALNADSIARMGLVVLAAVVLHNLMGLAAGYGCARILTGDRRIARTLAIEVGMQNSGLAVALAQQYFSAAAALPGAVFSVWHNVSGALFAAACARRARYGPNTAEAG
ncbi:bile acid:sodium symporter family protein [Salinisphaera sp.]|uniref:bile acid:sodium symporter family protein n=1 Tax=Salinisphaera sp. TaxID=1914330 RepID=UPI000C549681|nr:bile acid:sodium symporter family protein [Salinisphaera sp.]MBS63756.1 bile acid:sodium symporter [Salinisphaera sp.]